MYIVEYDDLPACRLPSWSISGYSCHIPTNSHHLLAAHTTHHSVSDHERKESQQVHSPAAGGIYDPVSAVSGTRPTAAVEMKSNVAYGTTAAATAASGNITYETVLRPQ